MCYSAFILNCISVLEPPLTATPEPPAPTAGENTHFSCLLKKPLFLPIRKALRYYITTTVGHMPAKVVLVALHVYTYIYINKYTVCIYVCMYVCV